MKKAFFIFLVIISCCGIYSQPVKTITILQDEKWFGAAVNEGDKMPFKEGYSLNLNGDAKGNQATSLLVSTHGRYIWSNMPFAFSFSKNHIIISEFTDSIVVNEAGNSLKDAYKSASARFFPPSGKLPDMMLFEKPQYNTWIELTYNQNQKDILKYAHDIIDNGFPPGVLMIDDNWSPSYGTFKFRDRFPDPKAMISELHSLGFKVMIWVCPFISPDSEASRYLLSKKLVLMDNDGNDRMKWSDSVNPKIIRWWNGYSFVLDFSNPEAVEWYKAQLNEMVLEYGIDGFKFDAGDPEYYPVESLSYKEISANEHTRLWGLFGLDYPLNEYRAMWQMGNEPLVERLRDKFHTWEDLNKLIPHITAAGIMGYTFSCPDMIGGGDFSSFTAGADLDQELIVRSAQCHALMPMMQFSVAPWRVLDEKQLEAVKKALQIRYKFTNEIIRLAEVSAETGEPIVRTLEYEFPNEGFVNCQDQFMLGSNIMVAPMLQKGTSRMVVFPKGKWKDKNNVVIKGPARKQFDIPLDEILWFTLQ